MKKSSMWKTVSAVMFGILIISEVLLGVSVLQLGILPAKFLVLVFALLIIGAAAPGLLMFWKMKKVKTSKKRARCIIAYVFSAAVIILCLLASFVVIKLNGTMQAVTEDPKVEALVGIYVLADDPAESIEEAGDYVFAVTDSFDKENAQKAVAEIEGKLGRTLDTKNYESVFGMVDALYNNEVEAIVLNKAYVSILEDLDSYEDFSDRTKELYEYSVMKEDTGKNEGEGDSASDGNVDVSSDPFVLYLSGSDTRSTTLKTSRSDVNILAVVNPKTHQILLINTPRDYYIANPAGNGALDKLTHCGIYGLDCSMEALSQLYDESINYYGQINFTGFETLIDAIGGVTITSDVSFTTRYGKYLIQKGENHLNGHQALCFARERYALKGGDQDRGKNQMKVITAVIEQISAGKIVNNYSEIMDSLQGMFATNFTTDEITKLAKLQISEMPDWEVFSYAVSGTGASETTYSIPGMALSVTKPNQDTVDKASGLIDRVMAGEILTKDDLK